MIASSLLLSQAVVRIMEYEYPRPAFAPLPRS